MRVEKVGHRLYPADAGREATPRAGRSGRDDFILLRHNRIAGDTGAVMSPPEKESGCLHVILILNIVKQSVNHIS